MAMIGRREQQKRHEVDQSRGGWMLFARLLLWSTRNGRRRSPHASTQLKSTNGER